MQSRSKFYTLYGKDHVVTGGRKPFALGSMVLIGTILLLLAALMLTAGCTKSTPKEESTLKIGAPLALTGWWNAAYDNSILRMAEMSVEMINEGGGVTVKGKKYPIELIVEDTRSDFNGVSSACNRLIHEKGCKFIIGPSGFYVSAATPVTEQAKVMMITGWHTNMPGEIDASTPYTFGTSQGSLTKDVAVIKSMRRDYPDMKKIAIVSPDDGSVPHIMPWVKRYLTENGFSVVGDVIQYPNEIEDCSPIVAKILALKDFEAIFIEKAPPPALANMVKGLREKGCKVPVFSGSPISTAEIATMAGVKATEGVRTTIDTANDPDMPAIMTEMAKRVTAKYGADFPLSYQCAVGVYIYKEVIEAAESFDPTVVKNKLESMTEVNTIYGKGPVCGKEAFGIKHIIAHPLPVQVFKNGQPKPGGWLEVGIIP